jgi:hypothetical protein
MTDPDRQLAEDYALIEDNINTYRLTPAQIAERAYLAGLTKGKELGRGEVEKLKQIITELQGFINNSCSCKYITEFSDKKDNYKITGTRREACESCLINEAVNQRMKPFEVKNE